MSHCNASVTADRHWLLPIALEIRPNVFYPSLAIGFLVTVVLCTPKAQELTLPHPTWLNLVFEYLPLLDVSLLQLASLGLLMGLAYKYVRYTSSWSKRSVIASVLLGFPFLMVIEVLLEQFLIKPSFHYARPELLTSEGILTTPVRLWLSGLIAALGGATATEGSSAPSGFVMRQTVILLSFLSLSHQIAWSDVVPSRVARRVHHIVQYGFFALIPLLRFYTGHHSIFDIGLAVGVAVILYWFIFVVFSALIRRDSDTVDHLGGLLGPLACYSLVILLYSQHVHYWAWTSFVMILAVGMLHRHRVRTRKEL